MTTRYHLIFIFSTLLALGFLLDRPVICQSFNKNIVLLTDYLEYELATNGLSLRLSDSRTKQDYLLKDLAQPFAIVTKDGKDYGSSSCRFRKGKLTCVFGASGVTVVIKVILHARYLVFKVVSVSDPAVGQLRIGEFRLTPQKYSSGISGMVSDGEYAIAARSLNLQGRVSVGGSPVKITSTFFAKYNIIGACFVLIGCPYNELRSVLKEVVRKEGLPYSPLGGPFALDAKENRGSYLFATPSEQDIDQWIEKAKLGGFSEIHLVGWHVSLGHYFPRKDLYPHGLAGLKSVVDKIHAAGLKAGLHTLTGCISVQDSWVTPVPDKRFFKDATLMLAVPLSLTDTVIHTTKAPPSNLPTFWSYQGTGNTLQLGDEIIAYTGISRNAPYGFTGCIRGKWGTRPAVHEQGEKVEHLRARYNAYLPDENSTLVGELADAIAKVYNNCGFDMIYLDGAEGMGDWHAIATMKRAIFTRLKRSARVESSIWDAESWIFHSCVGAWDNPIYGLKRFVDLHFAELPSYNNLLLPGQAGWWAITGPSSVSDAERPDEMEYLAAKCLGWNVPMSLQGISLSPRPANARQPELLATLGNYERLRLAGYFSKTIQEKLRVPGDEFYLAQTANGEWQLTPTDYFEHRVTALTDGSSTWTVRNRYNQQPVKLRIQALYSPEPYDTPQAVSLADFSNVTEEFIAGSASVPNVKVSITSTTDYVKAGKASGVFEARNDGQTRLGAWAHVDKLFVPGLNAGRCGAFGVWVYGDGKGELLNIRLQNSPDGPRATDDHYLQVNFTGWKYFEFLLRERDVEDWAKYRWGNSKYSVFRSSLTPDKLGGLQLFYNDLPLGEDVKCYLSPVKALPIAKVNLNNPTVIINGKRILFPVALESGQYIEFTSLHDCRVRDERGEVLQTLTPQGEAPELTVGDNTVSFDCKGPTGYNARAKVTVISAGSPLSNK